MVVAAGVFGAFVTGHSASVAQGTEYRAYTTDTLPEVTAPPASTFVAAPAVPAAPPLAAAVTPATAATPTLVTVSTPPQR